MYDLPDEDAVVDMLAYNLALRGCSLDSLDGWADIKDPDKVANPFSRRYKGEIASAEVLEFSWTPA